jgi:glycosyltransferase involved in cell wall biosynthesis
MKLAMFVTKYSLNLDRYLTDILANELKSQFDAVDVYLVDWYNVAKLDFYEVNGIKIYVSNHRIKLFHEINILKWFFGPIFAYFKFKKYFSKDKYDLTIVASPLIPVLPLLWLLKRASRILYLVYWDFYPFHQIKLGLIKSELLIRIFILLENLSINQFDYIGLMTPKNLYFFHQYYKFSHPKLEILPVWGENNVIPSISDLERNQTRLSYEIPVGNCVAVFGGQITHGRGIEELAQVAEILSNQQHEITMVFVGNGPMLEFLKSKKLPNILLIDSLPKDQYIRLLQSCDIGVVYTKEIKNLSTFPSKSIDYIRVGIPICAAVEADSDYRDIIENQLQVGLCCKPDEIQIYAENLIRLASDSKLREKFRENTIIAYQNRFSVNQVAREMMQQVNLNVK